MATNNTPSFVTHQGNGTSDTFAISFAFLSDEEVNVTVDGVTKTLGTHFTVSGQTIEFISSEIPVNGAAMSLTLKYLINSKDRQLAAYLNIADGTFKRVEEAETARQEQIDRMKQKTEELAYQNQMKGQQRQKDLLWNATHPIGMKRIVR